MRDVSCRGTCLSFSPSLAIILDSNSVLFSPYCHVWTARIERIQKKISRIAIHRLQWALSPQLDYLSRCLGLQTLEHRRQALQATFVAKVISGDIDSPYLLEKLNLYAPERPLRIRELVRPTFSGSAHSYNAPINQMIHSLNTYQRFFDERGGERRICVALCPREPF